MRRSVEEFVGEIGSGVGVEEEEEDEEEEDENPPTDTSEDSVDVGVTPPIARRPNYAQLRRLPRKFRKAFEKDVPVDFSLTAASPATPRFRGESSPPPGSPVLSPPPPPPQHQLRVPKSNRRKLTEPRRLIDSSNESTTPLSSPSAAPPWPPGRCHKRVRDEEEPPRAGDDDQRWSRPPRAKLARRGRDDTLYCAPSNGGVEREDEEVSLKKQQDQRRHHIPPPPGILGGGTPNPFLVGGHFVPPPHLLLPPSSWRYPYAHLVGGVLGPPLGILPTTPYPLLPLLPPQRPPPPHSPPTTGLPPGGEGFPPAGDEKSKTPVVVLNGDTGLTTPLLEAKTEGASAAAASKAVVKKFLSVETFLNCSPESDSTRTSPPAIAREPPPPPPTPLRPPPSATASPSDEETIQSLLQRQPKQKQRNYKNMTRERRIEANARERTRVHTISAAFETLRRAVPSFSHNQKLSKLSVLRIASAYILSLSRLAGRDYSQGGSGPSFEECVDLTTKTIQVEGKAKKKKDD